MDQKTLEEETIRLELLPEKSRTVYFTEYDRFVSWRAEQDSKVVDEDYVSRYFEHLSTMFQPSSLWAKFSMLRATLIFKESIDISKFYKLKKFLKEKNEGFERKKSKVFTEEEIRKFMQEAPDKKYLIHKLVTIMGLLGACRRDEIYRMKYSDMEENEKNVIVRVTEARTKKSRVFVIEHAYFDLYKKYVALRPRNASRPNFFLKYVDGKIHNHVVGLQKIGTFPKEIATWLKLSEPNKYTGHSFRRSSKSILRRAGPKCVLDLHRQNRQEVISANNKVSESNAVFVVSSQF